MDLTNYRNKLISVLRDDVFCELMNFWKKVEESSFDYKIFVSKKCYVLYKVFRPLFNFSSYEPCIKLTDTAIPIYLNKMKNKKVLIVDDVFIHGRTSLKINGEIKPYAKDVRFYVFAKNNNQDKKQDISTEQINDIIKQYHNCDSANDIDDKTFESFFYIGAQNSKEKKKENSLIKQSKVVEGQINCKEEYQWKRISDLIMKSIWSVNIPYVSYLPTFTVNNLDKFKKINCKPLSSRRQRTLSQKFSYHVQSCKTESSLIHYCFIISENEFTNDCKLTPMVFFDCENTSINKDFVYYGVKSIYEQKFDELSDAFLQKGKTANGLISMLKFLIFNVGLLSSMRLFDEYYMERPDYDIDYTNAIYSFGEEIAGYIKTIERFPKRNDVLKKIESCTIKNTIHKKNAFNKQQEEKLIQGLDEAYESTKTCKIDKDSPYIIDVLAKYFKYNNIYDEQNVYKLHQESYARGLKFSTIKDFLDSKGFCIYDIISGLMYQYNLGAATIDFLYDYDADNNIIGINMYWRSGEQSYKCITHTYVLLVYFQNLYKRMFDKSVSEFLYNFFEKVAEANYLLWNVPFSKKDFEKYCSLKDDIYDAFDIKDYCKEKEFTYLGFIGKQIEQYIMFGHLAEAYNNDEEQFRKNLLSFIEKRSSGEIFENCKKIL